jgi:DNA-directed RNA polymerase subunit RPC12/RpoP
MTDKPNKFPAGDSSIRLGSYKPFHGENSSDRDSIVDILARERDRSLRAAIDGATKYALYDTPIDTYGTSPLDELMKPESLKPPKKSKRDVRTRCGYCNRRRLVKRGGGKYYECSVCGAFVPAKWVKSIKYWTGYATGYNHGLSDAEEVQE